MNKWTRMYFIFLAVFILYVIVAGVANFYWKNEALAALDNIICGIGNLVIAVGTAITYVKSYLPTKRRMAQDEKRMEELFREMGYEGYIPPAPQQKWFGAFCVIAIILNIGAGLNNFHVLHF